MPKKKKQRNKTRPSTPPRFGIGTQVRVKPGTKDPDFPDIPLGGWAGTITEVYRDERPPTYLIEWNDYTLEHMHPVYKKRCERDGYEYETMTLSEDDLELDTGGPAVIEQPGEIVPGALLPGNQDDRVRIALGLTSDDPLSEVNDETLAAYHAYLSQKLTFPFRGSYSKETGPLEDTSYDVTVLRLWDADDCDEFEGLICKVRQGHRSNEVPLGEIEVKKGDPNAQLVEDYSYWFWNYR